MKKVVSGIAQIGGGEGLGEFQINEFFKKAFEKRIADKKKQLYSYTTCATDTQNISVVFSAVQGIIMKNVANSDGLGANFM